VEPKKLTFTLIKISYFNGLILHNKRTKFVKNVLTIYFKIVSNHCILIHEILKVGKYGTKFLNKVTILQIALFLFLMQFILV
jgi:hypothetical protein